jgi:uncharacterized membrane protein YphA (DoxX/SURF4 family)
MRGGVKSKTTVRDEHAHAAGCVRPLSGKCHGEGEKEEGRSVMKSAPQSLARTILFSSPWFYLVARISIGLIFISTGLIKLSGMTTFMYNLSGCGLVPDKFLVPVAIIVPVAELVAGVGLVLDLRGGLELTSWLLLMFLLVFGYGYFTSSPSPCGGLFNDLIAPHGSFQSALLRDLGLFVVMLYLFQWERARKQT